jgi:hypothetical protein
MPEETDRTAVRTYVPAYQKDEWAKAAEAMDMSRSEFVRTMVQAGRQEFEVPGRSDGGSQDRAEPDEGDITPGVEPLKTRILDALEDGPLSWEAIIAEVTEDVERRAEDCLQELQAADRLRYSGREGGYVLTDE